MLCESDWSTGWILTMVVTAPSVQTGPVMLFLGSMLTFCSDATTMPLLVLTLVGSWLFSFFILSGFGRSVVQSSWVRGPKQKELPLEKPCFFLSSVHKTSFSFSLSLHYRPYWRLHSVTNMFHHPKFLLPCLPLLLYHGRHRVCKFDRHKFNQYIWRMGNTHAKINAHLFASIYLILLF